MERLLLFLFISICVLEGIAGQSLSKRNNEQPITGQLFTDFGIGVEGVKIILKDEQGHSLPFTTSSQPTGQFNLPSLQNISFSSIVPTKEDDFENGVNVIDLHLLREAIQYQQFDSPYQKLAADINGDGSASEEDFIQLRKFLLSKNNVQDRDSWRFYDADCTPPISNPFGVCAQSKHFEEKDNLNFVAIKVGDLNNTASPNTLQHKSIYTTGNLILNTKNRYLKAGHVYTIPIQVTQSDILACQFDLELYGIELLNISTIGFCHREDYLIKENSLSFSVSSVESGQFMLLVRPDHDIDLRDAISIDERKTKSIAYDDNETIRGVKLAFDEKTLSAFRLFENRSKTINETTAIRFFNPKPTLAKLNIFDTNGSIVHSVEQFFPKGMNRFSLSESVFKSTGVYFYQLETENESDIKKMVILNLKEHTPALYSSQEQAGYKKLHSLSRPTLLTGMLAPVMASDLVQQATHPQE